MDLNYKKKITLFSCSEYILRNAFCNKRIFNVLCAWKIDYIFLFWVLHVPKKLMITMKQNSILKLLQFESSVSVDEGFAVFFRTTSRQRHQEILQSSSFLKLKLDCKFTFMYCIFYLLKYLIKLTVTHNDLFIS